jgi:hypothetical protein
MTKTSSIALTAMIIGILLPVSFNFGLEPVVYSSAIDTEWQLSVTGLVNNPLNLTVADLINMPQTTLFAQIFCVGPPSFFVEEGNYTGVKLKYLLDEAGFSSNAVKVAFFASDGFSTDLTIAAAQDDVVIVAYEKDGEPLVETLRLVVPGRWGYKWIYHLNRIEVVNVNFLGRYETQGYSDSAEIIMSGSPPGTTNVLPGKDTLNGTDSSPSPQSSPSPSPIQNPSPTPTPQPEGNSETQTSSGITEEIIYTAAVVAAIATVSVSLIVYFLKYKKKTLKEAL